MTLIRLWAIAALLPLLGGCYGVYSGEPVGEKPRVLVPEEWEGTWTHRDGAVTVAVTDKDRGLLQVGWVEKKQGRLVSEIHQVELRQSGPWTFGNVRDPDDPARVLWARVRQEHGEIVVWIPDRARFEDLVRQRQLEGRIDKEGQDVFLTGFNAAAVKRLMARDGGLPLDLEHPIVLHRLSR